MTEPLALALAEDPDVSLSVLSDMRLIISPTEIARAGEHNSALFRIISQPPSLDAYTCRAEVMTAEGTTYRLVVNGEFRLTFDMAVAGINRLQLVYSDGIDVTRKTVVGTFQVLPSLNAVDEGNPDFVDGLAQLQSAAFANVTYDSSGGLLAFYNVTMQPRGSVIIAGGGGGGGIPDVPPVNGAYARTFAGGTAAWTDFAALGVAGLYSPEFTGVPTAPTAGAGNSTPQLATTQYVSRDFLPRAGGQMTGPLIASPGTGLTNCGLAIGDNATGFYRTGNVVVPTVSGALIMQWFVDSVFMAVTLNMAAQKITTLADATAPQDALNQRSGDARYLQPFGADARYLQLAGGTLSGTLITAPGVGQNNLGIAVGDGNTGFYRGAGGAGADLMTLVAGFPMLVLTSTREAVINGPLSLGLNRISAVADPAAASDVATKGYVDSQALARSLLVELPGDVVFTSATFANLLPITYAIPRGGNSRIMISVILDCSTPGDQQIGVAGVRCDAQPSVVRHGWVYQVNGACTSVTSQFVFDVAGTSVTFNVQCANMSGGAPGGAASWTALTGSQTVVQDLGPR
jgi:hypothetical protein